MKITEYFNECLELAGTGDSDSDILDAIRYLKDYGQKRDFGHSKYHEKCIPKWTWKFPTHKPGCPTRSTWLSRLAYPRVNLIEATLELFSCVLEPERVARLVRLIQEIQEPKPKRPDLCVKKKKIMRRKKKKSKKESEMEWLKRQADISSRLIVDWLKASCRLAPNYRQLIVSHRLMKSLKLKKRKDLSKFTKREVYKICQQLAVLCDQTWEPYKRTVHIEGVKSKPSVLPEDQKHVVYKMRKPEEEEESTEIEEVWEEEPEEEEVSFYEFEFEEEPEAGYEGDIDRFVEEEMERMAIEIFEGSVEEEEEEFVKIVAGPEEESILEEEEAAEAEEEEAEEEEQLEKAIEEEIMKALEAEELPEAMPEEGPMELEGLKGEGYITESEIEYGIAGEELGMEYEPHPFGTASYILWCLYKCWLQEVQENIQLYGDSLDIFNQLIAIDGSSRHADIFHDILPSWADYLSDANQIDKAMVDYFRDKPITKCPTCFDYFDLYHLPTDHYIPPELLAAVAATKNWHELLRRLVALAASMLEKSKGGVIDARMPGSSMSVLIRDVVDSVTSGFIVQDYEPPTKKKKPHKK